MNNKNQKIVTRFAPSPTGFMHVGSVRTALYAWLWARKNNGTFILRIEDTDKEREVEGSIDHIQKSLKWLGLDWDFGPDESAPFGSCIQSERLDVYRRYAQILIEKGYAYVDQYTEEEVDEFRKKAEEEKKPFLYREHRKESTDVWDGTKPLRFKVQNLKRYTWQDAVWGELSAGEEALDDFILIKTDGYPTYNFAHIVDDIEMKVTHVMRGQEFISSTPKFLSLYEAIGIQAPIFATLPPIMAPDGKKKLSKRDGAKDLLEYKKEGYLSDAFINFLALLGWNPGTDQEIFTRQELIDTFDISKIQHSGAGLNEEKLNWVNKEHIKKLDTGEQFKTLVQYVPEDVKTSPQYSEMILQKISHLIIERIEKWGDVTTLFSPRGTLGETSPEPGSGEGDFVYFFTKPTFPKEMLYWKDDRNPENTKKRLLKVLEIITDANDESFSNPEKVKALIWDYANEEGRGQVLWPTRVALSGREKSPDPFTLISILGKEESILRIKKAIEILL
ncbi:MAG: glutamate--tRNA ligase [Minisyncoccota bacterium]